MTYLQPKGIYLIHENYSWDFYGYEEIKRIQNTRQDLKFVNSGDTYISIKFFELHYPPNKPITVNLMFIDKVEEYKQFKLRNYFNNPKNLYSKEEYDQYINYIVNHEYMKFKTYEFNSTTHLKKTLRQIKKFNKNIEVTVHYISLTENVKMLNQDLENLRIKI